MYATIEDNMYTGWPTFHCVDSINSFLNDLYLPYFEILFNPSVNLFSFETDTQNAYELKCTDLTLDHNRD